MGMTSGKQKTRRRIHFLFLPLSFFLVEVFAFLFLSLNTEEFRLAQLWPLAFGALWAAILSSFVRLFPECSDQDNKNDQKDYCYCTHLHPP